jgi:hypothetical protein
MSELEECLDDLMHTNEGNDDWRKRIDTAVIAILKELIDQQAEREKAKPA